MQVLEKLNIKIQLHEKKNKFNAIILSVSPMNNSFNGEILGRSLTDWVAFACNNIPVKVIDYDNKTNILQIARENITSDYDYTLILLSTTPLLEQSVISNIIEYCTYKDIKLCKLPVGYVVSNEYLLNSEDMSVDSFYSQDIEDFYVVENKKQYTYALEVLQNRINNFHIDNGVDIRSPKTVYIEPEVDIEKGVIVYSGNSLKGKTTIAENVILKENNVIEDSKIGKNSCISGSVISGSIIASNVYISAFCEINNSLIEDDCIISSGCKLNDYRLKINTKLKANTVLGEENDSDNRSGQSR